MNNSLTTINFAPIIPVPDDAPKPKFEFDNPHLSFEDVLPKTYLSMEALQSWLELRKAESRLVTVTGVTMELLYDPARETADKGEWKPVLWFDEMEPGLPVNQTRGLQLTKMTGSPFLAQWAKVGMVAIRPGIVKGKAQIVIAPVSPEMVRPNRSPADYSPADANDDLFS